jgi:hypothetical protein
MVCVGESELQKEVRLASCRDAFAKEARQSIQNGAKSHFHLRNGLLWYKQNQLYVPEGKIRDTLSKECHDGPLVGHGGAKRTTTFLKKSYYWPNLKLDAKEYVKTCWVYQQNRTLNKKQAGLLRPLPIPEGLWESVSMDFMVSFPPSKGFDAIMVVVDRFNKMAHFIPTKDEAMAQETGRLFFSHIFNHHGLPKDIVSDRNPKFTSKFWRALWKRMGLELKMSTLFRPPNRWANRKGQLGDPTIPKELCGGGSTRLGGPFGVSRVLLQQLGTLRNGVHSISNGDGQVTNCAHDLGITRTNSK